MVVWTHVAAIMVGAIMGFMTCAILTVGKLADEKLYKGDHDND
jgi:hypothetical protein